MWITKKINDKKQYHLFKEYRTADIIYAPKNDKVSWIVLENLPTGNQRILYKGEEIHSSKKIAFKYIKALKRRILHYYIK